MPSLPQDELSRAVLIGTSDFEFSDRLPDLPAVQQNLTGIATALRDSRSGILSWEQCVTIDTPDSPASFMGRLRKAANQAEDLLLVYYAGHGIRHDTRDELYLTVRETNPEVLDGTAVPFAWLREAIEHSPARTRLLILDCCYSGMALGSMSSGEIDPRDVEISGTSVITSAPKNQISHSPPGERHTAFTGELISLLNEGPRLADELLTVHNLYRGLVAAMSSRQLPTPKMRAGDLSGDLVLRRSVPFPPTPAPAPPQQPPTTRLPERETTGSQRQGESQPMRPVLRTDPHPPGLHQPQLQVPDHSRTPAPPRAGATQPIVRRVTTTGWLVLWLFFAMLVDMVLGGVIGYFIGTPQPGASPQNDLFAALSAAVFAAPCCVVLWRRTVYRNRRGDHVTLIGELRDVHMASLAQWPSTVLGVVAACSVGLAIGGAMANNEPVPDSSMSDPASSMSNMAISVALMLWLCQLAAACAYTLVQRHRQRE